MSVGGSAAAIPFSQECQQSVEVDHSTICYVVEEASVHYSILIAMYWFWNNLVCV